VLSIFRIAFAVPRETRHLRIDRRHQAVTLRQLSALSVNGRGAMSFGFLVSFGLIILAIVGVFIYVPLASDYAFWLAVGAYAILAGATFHHHHHRR
jgi:hypothetical protein